MAVIIRNLRQAFSLSYRAVYNLDVIAQEKFDDICCVRWDIRTHEYIFWIQDFE